jgi:hypothetical protein
MNFLLEMLVPIHLQLISSLMLSTLSVSFMSGFEALHNNSKLMWSIFGQKLKMLTVVFPSLEVWKSKCVCIWSLKLKTEIFIRDKFADQLIANLWVWFHSTIKYISNFSHFLNNPKIVVYAPSSSIFDLN